MNRSSLALRASILFMLVGHVETLLHELAHASMALALGGRPTLYPTAVRSADLHGVSAHVAVAAAGPVFSVILGGVAFVAMTRLRAAATDLQYAAVCLAFHGFIGGVGYLVLTPFDGNDLGNIALLLHWPPLVRWLAFGLGVFFMGRISRVLVPALVRLVPPATPFASADDRFAYVRDVAIIPWLALMVTAVAVAWPPQTLASFAPTASMGIPLVSAAIDARKNDELRSGERAWNPGIPWPALVALVALLVFVRLVVFYGVPL